MTELITDPDLDHKLTAPYWDGFLNNEIRVPNCGDCGEYHWVPREICPHCNGRNVNWKDVGTRATLFTWVGIEYDFKLPYLKNKVPLYTGLIVPHRADSVRLPALIHAENTPEIDMDLEAKFHENSNSELVFPIYHQESLL